MASILFKNCAVFCSVFLVSCAGLKHSGKSKAVPGVWQATPIIVDGDCADWPSPYPNYDAKAKVAYATSNDKENLYVTLQTGDPLTQIKILKQGMTVSIDTSGHKEATFNINYPLQNEDDLSELFARTEHGQGGASSHLARQFDQKLKKSAESCNQFSLDGFGPCNGGYLISQDLPCGVKVKLGIDEYKQLVWEAVIPFKAIYQREAITPLQAGKPISVSFSVKGFKAPSTKAGNTAAMPMANNGMSPGGGGLGAGGAMNSTPMGTAPGGGANKVNPMQHLYESTKTWKHFTIAWQK